MQGYSFRDKVKASHKKRAAAVSAPGSFDKWDVLARLGKQGHRCHYCQTKLEVHGPQKFVIDHFIPLSRGGSNWATNIVLACQGCNLSKGSKMPWEYRPAMFTEGCKRDG